MSHAPTAILERAVAPLAEPGRPLFAGLRAQWDDPADPWTRLFHLGDMLREYRGDAHVCAWSSAGVDAVEIGLLTELYMGLPLRTYIRTRGWNDAELDGAVQRLRDRGLLDDADALTPAGADFREAMERATDRAWPPHCARWATTSTVVSRAVAPMGRGDAGGRWLRGRTRRPLAEPQLSGAPGGGAKRCGSAAVESRYIRALLRTVRQTFAVTSALLFVALLLVVDLSYRRWMRRSIARSRVPRRPVPGGPSRIGRSCSTSPMRPVSEIPAPGTRPDRHRRS